MEHSLMTEVQAYFIFAVTEVAAAPHFKSSLQILLVGFTKLSYMQ
jgi:hypothetical protein